MFLTPCSYSMRSSLRVSSRSCAPSSTPGIRWQWISNKPWSVIFLFHLPLLQITAKTPSLYKLIQGRCLNIMIMINYSSVASSAGASRAFMLRLIFLSSPLKSTTLASISCPIDSTSAGLATCSLEIWDT